MGSGDIEACNNNSADESLEKEPSNPIFELQDVTSRAKSMLCGRRAVWLDGFCSRTLREPTL